MKTFQSVIIHRRCFQLLPGMSSSNRVYLVAVLIAASQAAEETTEAPLLTSSDSESESPKASGLIPDLPPLTSFLPTINLFPSNKGRSDIDIEKEEKEQPSGGYVYPKPTNPLYLPPFMTLGSKLPAEESAASVEALDRSVRSPQMFASRGRGRGQGRGRRGPRQGQVGTFGMMYPGMYQTGGLYPSRGGMYSSGAMYSSGGMYPSFAPMYPSGGMYQGIRPQPALYGSPMSLLQGIQPY